jgi:hypothetical protein
MNEKTRLGLLATAALRPRSTSRRIEGIIEVRERRMPLGGFVRREVTGFASRQSAFPISTTSKRKAH